METCKECKFYYVVTKNSYGMCMYIPTEPEETGFENTCDEWEEVIQN